MIQSSMQVRDMRRRPSLAGAAMVVVLLVTAACGGGGPAGDSPAGVVRSAVDKVAAKDLDGLRSLACAGQENMIRDQLGLPAALGSQLLPGMDTQALLDAVQLDVSNLKVGEAAISGDTAQVPVSGEMNVTFDADKIRPIVRQVLESQGTTVSDAALDSMLQALQNYGQDVPLNTSVRLVRESGAWKICQASLASPLPS